MTKYEYKTIEIKLKGTGLFGTKQADGFDETLNREGEAGWRYVDTLLETCAYGEVSRIKLIFERQIQ